MRQWLEDHKMSIYYFFKILFFDYDAVLRPLGASLKSIVLICGI